MVPLRIHLFGPFEVWLNDRPLPRLRSRKSQWLLALLALRQGAEVEREWLAGLLWPERVDRQALRNSLTQLRRALGKEAVRLRSPTAHTLSLDLAGAVVDLVAFDAAIGRGDRLSLAEAVGLYRGPLLEGWAEEWAFQERQVREQAYLTALERLAAEALAGADAAAAEGYLRRAAAVDPLRESSQRGLMEALAASGNYGGALLVYRELRLRLHQELHAAPDAETQALFQRLREEAREKVARGQGGGHPSGPRAAAISAASREPRAASRSEAAVRAPTAAENRLVTVLFAGMSRSVAATQGLDPEEAAALVNRLLGVMADAILEFGGHVDRFLGHGVLALFGAPQVHEDDPERAIRAAIQIQEAAWRLGIEVTAGINTGEVYLGAVGSERHQEVTVAGPVVSLASWLQGQAEPGQILAGEGTYRQTRRAFEFCPLSLEIQGLTAPVSAYAVTGALTHPEKTRGIEGLRAELIGRDEELAKLKAVVAQVVQGSGQMVSLVGEAGVGKSRLVTELKLGLTPPPAPPRSGEGSKTPRRDVHSPPLRFGEGGRGEGSTPLWLEGRCLERSMGAGYSVFVDLFHDYDHRCRGGAPWRSEGAEDTPGRVLTGEGFRPSAIRMGENRSQGERLAAVLREFLAGGELALDRVEEIGPLLDHLLSPRVDADWDQRLQNASPDQIHYQTCLAVRDFLVALSRRQPLLLVLEDLHWADSLSLNLLSVLMESLPLAPIGLLCVYRTERAHKSSHLAAIAEQTCPERFVEIRLRELTPEQSGRLVASLLPIEHLPGRIKEQILQKSRGNPFFLEELVRSLIDSRLVYREGDRWRAWGDVETLTVPESVQSLILSRFDRLRPELKQVLQCAAVIGALFRPRLLERVVATDGSAAGSESQRQLVATALWELEDQGLVYEARAVPEAEYAFKHVLMQETIYQRILRSNRAELHQRVAEAMEALYRDELPELYEQLAYHYEHSASDEKAVEYLLKAGEKARRAYLNEDAIGYFRRALERPGDGASRMEALRGLGEIYQAIGKHAEAEEQFRQAIALGRTMGRGPRELARLYFRLGEALVWQRRAQEMISPAEEMLVLLGKQTESVETALMNEIAGMGYRWSGNWAEGLEYVRRNARFLQRLPYSEELRSSYSSVLMMYGFEEDDVEEATTWARILEEKARQHHDLAALGSVLEIRSGLLESRGDLCGAMAPLRQALEVFGKIGAVRQQYLCTMRMRRNFLLLGNLQEAEAYANRQREAAEAMGDPQEIVVSLVAIGTVLLCQGRWDRAMDAYRNAWQVSGEDRLRAWAAYALGRALLAQGQRSEARKQLQEAAGLHEPAPLHLVDLLSGLEEACDDPATFLDFCLRFRAEHPRAHDSPSVQWYLEPTQADNLASPGARFRTLHSGLPTSEHQIRYRASHDAGSSEIGDPVTRGEGGWVWHDPFGDCSFAVRNGLEIRAANGRDLCHPNQSAPRLLRPISGDFAVQAVCRSVSGAAPAIGGLLLWENEQHYLRLDWGAKGPHQLSVGGWLPGKAVSARIWAGEKDVTIGRGRLVAECPILRLERLAGWLRALCSADGRHWFMVAQTEFRAEGALEVGLHAIGTIDRMFYPGAYPEGTAIRFESFELWT